MKFTIKTLKIKDFIELQSNKSLVLNPPYQRNPIWSRKSQKSLITTIINNWPLPTIFLKETGESSFEVVDGQQRLRAIFQFQKNRLTDLDGNKIDQPNLEGTSISEKFNEYEIPVTIITEVDDSEKIEDFYALVNKSGLRLNKIELAKAEYYNTEFLSLLEELADSDSEFHKLGLFTKASIVRMNDIDFIAELLAMIKFGPSDKKEKVEELFEKDITSDEAEKMREQFLCIISEFKRLNTITPIARTRLRQKNDFYTVFGIINDLKEEDSDEAIEAMYKCIIRISNVNAIRPSQDRCDVLKDYATNCVTQSNSKTARENREKILKSLFFNESGAPNENQQELVDFFKTDRQALIKINGKWLTFDHKKLLDPEQPELFDFDL